MRHLAIGLTSLFCLSTAYAGYEIADVTDAWQDGFRGPTRVYLDYGENRIPDEAWDDFTPPTGYLKNTPRNAEFNAENTFSSPGMAEPNVQVETIGGYTWKFIAQIQSAMWPYNTDLFPGTLNAYQAAFTTVTPPAGAIKFSSNEKNQEMIFWAHEGNNPDNPKILRFFITDEWGNQYIMGASGAATDAEIPGLFDAAVLPTGWTKSTGYLDETLSLMPAYGDGNQAHYNLFRENEDNTFFQFVWGEEGGSIAAQIEGMPIWGGATSDRILGRAGDDNLIHGAEGDDLIIALGQNDLIYGDDGSDTVVFEGNWEDYTVIDYSDEGAFVLLGGSGFEKSIYSVEFFQFDNLTIATAAIPEPATLGLLGVAGAVVALARRRGKQNRRPRMAPDAAV